MKSLQQVQSDGEALTHAADALEDRLLANQDKVHLWQELGRRHQQVTAVAIANHSEHMESMVKLLVAQQEKQQKLKRGRAVAEMEMAYSTPAVMKKRHKRHD